MRKLLLIGLAGAVLLSGCAHLKPSSSKDSPDSQGSVDSRNIPAPKSIGDVLQQDINQSPTSNGTAKVTPSGDIIVNGIHLKNTKFDYPVTINSRVEHWIDYFTGRGRGYFEKYLERSEFFIPYIQPILRQNGAPEDLVYLAMIESGFNNLARSHAKAVGPWQFISATGKRYGLMVNWWVDERRDIAKSTVAAVGYLKELYNMFGSWELASAAYNAGENKIARAIQRYGSKDFWVLSHHRFLRPETRDYVPKIIAAAIIAKNREQFGFRPPVIRPSKDEAVASDGEVVKVLKTDKPEEQVAANANDPDDSLDDDLAEDEIGGPEITPATLTVPAENPSNEVANAPDQPLAKPVPTPHVFKNGEVGGAALAEFEVQSPADLLKVARAAGLSYQTVKALNPELLRWCTPPTVSSYRLRLPAETKDKFLTTYNHVAFPRQVQFMTYKVRRGETLSRVARHFGIRVDPISDLNGVSAKMPLRQGVRVLLPMPNDRSRSLASLEVRDPPERGGRRHSRRKRRGKYYRVTFKKRESARSSNKRVRDT